MAGFKFSYPKEKGDRKSPRSGRPPPPPPPNNTQAIQHQTLADGQNLALFLETIRVYFCFAVLTEVTWLLCYRSSLFGLDVTPNSLFGFSIMNLVLHCIAGFVPIFPRVNDAHAVALLHTACIFTSFVAAFFAFCFVLLVLDTPSGA
jgi:hypothetical protein